MPGPSLSRQAGSAGLSPQRQFGQWPALVGERLLVTALYFFINLESMHRHVRRGRDSDLHDLALHPDNLQVDASINNNAFAGFSRKDKHGMRQLRGHFGIRQRMLHRIVGGIGDDHLFANTSVPVDDNRPFEIDRGVLAGTPSHDAVK